MLEVTGISKTFTPPLGLRHLITLDFKRPCAVRALDHVSFSVPRGSSLAILGPNGAGKTTLLKIIATLVLPDTGTVCVNSLSLEKNEEQIKACIGLAASPERSFYWRLTGRQNLEFFAAMYGLNSRQAQAKVRELIDIFKVDYQDKRFDACSTGMQQTLALIRALLHDPDVLLLDEPTKSLDYIAACSLKHFIKDRLVRQHNKTVLFTTHHLDEAIDFADLFLILHRGQALAFGTLAALRAKINNPTAALSEIFTRLTTQS